MAVFGDLPDELVDVVIGNLECDGDLGSLSLVCRRLYTWIRPGLCKRFETLTVGGLMGNGGISGVKLQKHLLNHISSIMACPSLRYLTKTAYVGFVAYADVKEWRCDDLELTPLERELARDTIAAASRQAGFGSRGSDEENNLDFMIGLALILAPCLQEVKIDFSNITLCQFLFTVAGFRCVQDALPGDVSIWARR